MKFDRYLSRIPELHTWDEGKTWNSGGFEAFHLKAFHRLVGRSATAPVVLETGAGNSTLAFAYARPARLISIAPDQELFARIGSYAQQADLDLSMLEMHVDRSEFVLPRLADSGLKLDLALIDGGHGRPTVFVDFCYVNCMLRENGLLIIDDVQLHSIKELARLLSRQPHFEMMEDLGKSLVFAKRTNWQFLPDWQDEPYIVDRSRQYEHSSNPLALD